MPSKPTTRKRPKKITQLDRIEALFHMPHAPKGHNRFDQLELVGATIIQSLNQLSKRMEDFEARVSPAPKAAQVREFKEGDWVSVRSTGVVAQVVGIERNSGEVYVDLGIHGKWLIDGVDKEAAPKEEPIKVGDLCVAVNDLGVYNAHPKGSLIKIREIDKRGAELTSTEGLGFAPCWLRKATPEEIATHEREEKRKKLVFGAKVKVAGFGQYQWVFLWGHDKEPELTRCAYHTEFSSGVADVRLSDLTLVDPQ